MAGIVCNASPLIALAKAGLLSLLPELFDDVFVPPAVVVEIERGPADDPLRQLLPRASWLRVARLEPPLSPLAAWQLGAGEAEVLEYARTHPGLAVLLDDRAGRRAAFSLNLKVCGTLAILAMAHRRRLIPSFREAANALSKAGLHVTQSLVDEVQSALESS